MSSTWMPRAATSVATSTRTLPLVRSCRLRVRRAWLRSPWSDVAGMPASSSWSASCSANARVRAKISVLPSPELSCSMIAALSRCSMRSTRWSMVDDAWSSPATSWTLGFGRNSLTSVATPLSSVAEKSRRWPSFFTWRRIRCTGSRKPRSHMWSASSRTVTTISERSRRPWSMRSSRRPGVAMRMSTPRCSAPTCLNCGTPPKIVVVNRPTERAMGCTVRSICMASSRVGARISARGLRPILRFFAPSFSSRRSTRGAPNAMVLPDPVRPRPSTSRPASTSGIVAAWIGNGLAAPSSSSTRTMFWPRPSAAKVTPSTSLAVVAWASRRSSTTSSAGAWRGAPSLLG